jgi:branched-subunit amino acid transport protein
MSNTTNEFLIVLGMATVTFLIRYPLLTLVGRINLPDPVLRGLKFVPPAVLTAIIVPAILYKNDKLSITYENDYLIAGIVCVVVAWRTKNLLLTIVLGMASLLLWRWVLTF